MKPLKQEEGHGVPKEITFYKFYSNAPAQTWTGLWSHPLSEGPNYNSIEYWTELARIAEGGLLDGIFFADGLGAVDVYEGKPDAAMRSGNFWPLSDPLMVIPLMASVTKNLCFGVTGNTAFEPPFTLARRYSTLDHLSKGRMGLNIVTGAQASAAKSMGLELVKHDQRYDIADEYMDLLYKLWEGCWEDGAAVRDRESGIFTDPARVHRVRHEGEHYRCDGFHMCEPSPQRTPFLFAAGASDRGSRFAARHAEAALMSASSKSFAKHLVYRFRSAIKAQGRSADSLKIFNAVTVVVAPTDAEARDLQDEYQRYTSEEGNLAIASGWTGVDLSQYEPDEPIEYIESDAIQSVLEAMTKFNEGKKATVRDLARFAPSPGREGFIIGSTNTVCDELIDWVEATGLDGFMLQRTVEPAGLKSFIDLVVPELQNRGYYKTEYREGTMREKMFGTSQPHLPDTHYGARARALLG